MPQVNIPFPSNIVQFPIPEGIPHDIALGKTQVAIVAQAKIDLREIRKRIEVEESWCAEFLKAAVREHGGPIEVDGRKVRVITQMKRIFDPAAVYAAIKGKIVRVCAISASKVDACITAGMFPADVLAGTYTLEEIEIIDVR